MTRRGKGEASIFQRADGRWCAAISTGYGPKGRKRQYIYGRTRREVAEKLTTALAAQQNGESLIEGRVTVGQWLLRWHKLPSKRKQQTMDRYYDVIKCHLLPDLGHIKLAQLTTDDIDLYKTNKAKAGFMASSIRVHLFCLSAAIQDAQARKLLSRGTNVVRWSGVPAKVRHTPKFLDPTDARKFLAAAEGHPFGPQFVFILSTGLRIAESVAVRWSDIDRKRRFVTVSRQVVGVRGEGTTVSDVKSESGRRTIHLSDMNLAALDRQAELQAHLRAFGRGRRRWRDLDYVFTSGIGTPIDRNIVRVAYREILDKAGLAQRRVHDLRHSFGSLLLSEGVQLKVISEMLGHSSIAVTADIYTSVFPELQRDASVKLGSLLSPE